MKLLGRSGAAKKKLKIEITNQMNQKGQSKDIHTPLSLNALEDEVQNIINSATLLHDESYHQFETLTVDNALEGSRIINMKNLCEFIVSLVKHLSYATQFLL